MMTKRDFVLIARVLQPWTRNGDAKAQSIARDFADELTRYPNFNRARFLQACGIED